MFDEEFYENANFGSIYSFDLQESNCVQIDENSEKTKNCNCDHTLNENNKTGSF